MTQSVTYYEVQSVSIKPGSDNWINATEYGELFQTIDRAMIFITREINRNYDLRYRVVEITVTKNIVYTQS